MSKQAQSKPQPQPAAPAPVNVVDGIPDRLEKGAWRRYVLIAVVFGGWVAFLVYCYLAGRL